MSSARFPGLNPLLHRKRLVDDFVIALFEPTLSPGVLTFHIINKPEEPKRRFLRTGSYPHALKHIGRVVGNTQKVVKQCRSEFREFLAGRERAADPRRLVLDAIMKPYADLRCVAKAIYSDIWALHSLRGLGPGKKGLQLPRPLYHSMDRVKDGLADLPCIIEDLEENSGLQGGETLRTRTWKAC